MDLYKRDDPRRRHNAYVFSSKPDDEVLLELGKMVFEARLERELHRKIRKQEQRIRRQRVWRAIVSWRNPFKHGGER